jgi:hypothetical protein
MRATTLSVFFSIMIGLITAAHAAEFNDGQRKEIDLVKSWCKCEQRPEGL